MADPSYRYTFLGTGKYRDQESNSTCRVSPQFIQNCPTPFRQIRPIDTHFLVLGSPAIKNQTVPAVSLLSSSRTAQPLSGRSVLYIHISWYWEVPRSSISWYWEVPRSRIKQYLPCLSSVHPELPNPFQADPSYRYTFLGTGKSRDQVFLGTGKSRSQESNSTCRVSPQFIQNCPTPFRQIRPIYTHFLVLGSIAIKYFLVLGSPAIKNQTVPAVSLLSSSRTVQPLSGSGCGALWVTGLSKFSS